MAFVRARRWALPMVLVPALCWGCGRRGVVPLVPVFVSRNHPPVVDSLVATPDSIGPSDSTVVHCYAHDPDGDSLRFDWQTDARLRIPGQPSYSSTYLNNQPSPSLAFYNTNLPNPINDSAWVDVLVEDRKGGAAEREVFIILRRP